MYKFISTVNFVHTYFSFLTLSDHLQEGGEPNQMAYPGEGGGREHGG